MHQEDIKKNIAEYIQAMGSEIVNGKHNSILKMEKIRGYGMIKKAGETSGQYK